MALKNIWAAKGKSNAKIQKMHLRRKIYTEQCNAWRASLKKVMYQILRQRLSADQTVDNHLHSEDSKLDISLHRTENLRLQTSIGLPI